MTYWDDRFSRYGHTGYSEPVVYEYDQPIRLHRIVKLLDRLYPRGLRGLACLDIGCGAGDFVQLLSERGGQVIGIDISERATSFVHQRFLGTPNVRCLTGAVEDAAFPAGTFDLITSVTVLQHVIDGERLRRAARNLRTALGPRGRLVSLELAPAVRGNHLADSDYQSESHYMAVRSVTAWEAVFTSAGLSIEEVHPYAPIGLSPARRLDRRIARLKSRHAGLAGAEDWVARDGRVRCFLRRGSTLARWFILTTTAPLDRRVALSWQVLQPEHRIFVLQKVP